MNTANHSNAKLIIESAGMRRIIALETFPFTLGRGADRDLSLSQPQVSR